MFGSAFHGRSHAVHLLVLVTAAWVTSLLVCAWLRSFAIKRALLDVPNDRSLHTAPVPRLGGVGIVLGSWPIIVGTWAVSGSLRDRACLAWAVGSLPIALLGLVDDLRPLGSALRMLLHVVIAAAFCVLLDLPSTVALVGDVRIEAPQWVLAALATLWIVAVLNIYNFMDGMDGLAGTQAVGAGAALSASFVGIGFVDLALVAALIAAATLGFLVMNWPPAKVFMGDAGSTYLGFSFAAMAVGGAARRPALPLAAVVLALSPFLLDGTFTIARRLLRGERVWQAHRSHLYQRAVAAGKSHHAVLVRYALWIALAGLSGAVASAFGALVALALTVLTVAGLLVTWRWVLALENAVMSEKPFTT